MSASPAVVERNVRRAQTLSERISKLVQLQGTEAEHHQLRTAHNMAQMALLMLCQRDIRAFAEGLESLHMADRCYGGVLLRLLSDDAARGNKVLQSAIAGHVAVYGTDAEKDERKATIRKAVADARARTHRRVSDTAVRKQVADELGIGYSTVLRALGLKK